MSAGAALLPISRDLQGEVLALNNAHAAELSWLEPGELFALLGQAFYARRIGKLDAFLLAFDQSASYDSPNYLWFRERYPRFVYVDRVVVAAGARGHGLARLLYDDLFRCARVAGHDLVVCEVNVEPPNEASDALHAALGFTEVGRAKIHEGRKTVRYLTLSLVSHARPAAAPGPKP
jgi:predicted GNAT superfamily acetyltransferase